MKNVEHIIDTIRRIQGYAVDDFVQVIDKKTGEWMGTKFQQYLRPDTLFGSKFESYVNQQVVTDGTAKLVNDWRGS